MKSITSFNFSSSAADRITTVASAKLHEADAVPTLWKRSGDVDAESLKFSPPSPVQGYLKRKRLFRRRGFSRSGWGKALQNKSSQCDSTGDRSCQEAPDVPILL